ncbi:multidrug effflux MFS transporter [Ornithinimicrobium tianjinense]|uniref:MFS transporter n=1 Tax=Ornithinimicrobium tianjinense TaxID=1195761 RepID=A0A917BXM0_9MICO|nr:multidrug effflux MFS transporter [Ornithinimicrobium tianjinense]GGF60521.1 MFS transporter [Ornithinimicrobium tianjinense]
MTSTQEPRGQIRAAWLMTVLLAGLAMIGPFTIDTLFPGFVSIGRDFGADAAALQQLTSVYLLSFALMSIFHGPLSDSLGRKPVMIGGLAGYTVASAVCALAPTFGVLLAGRVAQGLCAGAATIVSRAVIRDLYSGAQAQRMMARVMMIFAVAPAVAPVIGGEILRFAEWPAIFWFVAGYAVLTALLTLTVLPETLPRSRRHPLRPGAVVGGLWRVARSWPFERLALCTTFVFASYFLYVVAAPMVVVDLLGLGEQDFWTLFVPMIAGMALGSWISTRVAERVAPERLVDGTLLWLLGAAVLNVLLVVLWPTVPGAVAGPALLGVSIGIVFPVLQLAMLDLFPTHRGAAASMASFASLVFNALLAGAIAPLVGGSLVTLALTSLAFAATGAALWWWHRRDRAPGPEGSASEGSGPGSAS